MSTTVYCGLNNPSNANYTVFANRVNELLPQGTSTTVLAPYTGTGVSLYHVVNTTNGGLNLYNLVMERPALVHYHMILSGNPSSLATAIGDPVVLTAGPDEYAAMVYSYSFARGPVKGVPNMSTARTTFVVSWESLGGMPGNYANGSLSSYANIVRETISQQPSFSNFNCIVGGSLYRIRNAVANSYVIVDMSDKLSSANLNIDNIVSAMRGSPAKWIVRCEGETEFTTAFAEFTSETLADGVTTIFRNF